MNKQVLVNKNNNILVHGEFKEIDDTLNYLINELKISTIIDIYTQMEMPKVCEEAMEEYYVKAMEAIAKINI